MASTDNVLTALTLRTITVSSTSLFDVAAAELGDAMQWSRIARLNGLVDPWITGIVDLKLPQYAPEAGTDGVLQS